MSTTRWVRRWWIGAGLVGCAGLAWASGCSDDETSTQTGTVVGTTTGSGSGTATGTAVGGGTSTGTAVGGGSTGGSGQGGGATGGGATGGSGQGGGATGGSGQGGGATGGGATGGGATGGGATGGGATGGGATGGQGGGACTTCDALWPLADDSNLCAGSQTLFDAAVQCICTDSCSNQCGNLSACGGAQQSMNNPCSNCATANCSAQIDACAADT